MISCVLKDCEFSTDELQAVTELLDEYQDFAGVNEFSLDAGLATLPSFDSFFEGRYLLNQFLFNRTWVVNVCVVLRRVWDGDIFRVPP